MKMAAKAVLFVCASALLVKISSACAGTVVNAGRIEVDNVGVAGNGVGLAMGNGYGLAGYGNGYGLAGCGSGYGLGVAGLGAVGLGAAGLGAVGYGSVGLGNVGLGGVALGGLPNGLVASGSGGAFPVTFYSPISPTGLEVISENVFEGPVAVAGQLPFLSAVALEGQVPSGGSTGVQYSCGNGNVGIISEGLEGVAYGAGLVGNGYAGAGYAGLGLGGAGYGLGLGNAGLLGVGGCGCGRY